MSKHKHTGFCAILSSYPNRNLFKSLRFPLTISTLSTLYVEIAQVDLLSLIKYLCSVILSFIPDILGFILTGYAVIIGLTGSNIIRMMSKKNAEEREASVFQIVNSTFAVVLLVLSFTLFVGFMISLISQFNIKSESDFITEFVNVLVVFLLQLLILYSIFSIKDIILNIFNFGEFIHVVNMKENIRKKKKESEINNE